jgi:DNA-binding NtrC family response regulator
MLRIVVSLKGPEDALFTLLQNHAVKVVAKDESFLKTIKDATYDVALIEEEIDLLPVIRQIDPRLEIILFGNGGDGMYEALRQGASAYFPLPVNLDLLTQTIKSLEELQATRRETAELEKLLDSKYQLEGVIGKNPRMFEIFSFIRRIAPYYQTITVMGETGTGKEVIAKALHALSPASKGPFVVCNCGGLMENLIESELFGHTKGAFTGAVSDKAGLFEAAKDGTILLDEVGELPPSFQPHLLRVLQDGEFRRIGSTQRLTARCRVIAATNKDLAAEVKKGAFREDLFYRLTPLTLQVPPLRDRKDDIHLITRHFLQILCQKMGKSMVGVSRPAQIAMLNHDWPGNIRELENVLHQAAILANESFISMNDLPAFMRSGTPKAQRPPSSLDDMSKQHIQAVLEQCKGNRSSAARVLGISRRALQRKIQKYGLV